MKKLFEMMKVSFAEAVNEYAKFISRTTLYR